MESTASGKEIPCRLSQLGVKLKFNEPWNSKSFHVATIAASRRTRSRTPRVFNCISFESQGIAWRSPRSAQVYSGGTCSLRVSDLWDIQDNLGARLPSIEPQCRIIILVYPLWFPERATRQAEDVGQLDLQHLPGRPVSGRPGRLGGFWTRRQWHSRRSRSFGQRSWSRRRGRRRRSRYGSDIKDVKDVKDSVNRWTLAKKRSSIVFIFSIRIVIPCHAYASRRLSSHSDEFSWIF